MARLVLHVRYFAPKTKNRATKLSCLMNYYATREGVEKPLPDEWKQLPASDKQKEHIEHLYNTIPQLAETHEWEDYVTNPNQGHALEIMNWVAEHKLDDRKPEVYLKYIAERPRVEKVGDHGLFSMFDEPIVLHKAAEEVAQHNGNVWTMVFSLRREDAERLGYNNAESWKILCRSKAGELAAAMKIPFDDFHWYAAFHNESHHPHIHMVVYSSGEEGYLNRVGIEDIKSTFAKNIFMMDLDEMYRKQTRYRNDLRQVAKDYLENVHDLPQEAEEFTNLIPILCEIKSRLPQKGKIKYGYMPKDVKNLVDEVVNRLEKHPKIAELYNQWYRMKVGIARTYTNNPPKKEPLSSNEAFKPIRNAVLEAVKDMDLEAVRMLSRHKRSSVEVDERQAQTEVYGVQQEPRVRLRHPENFYREEEEISPEEEAISFRAIESFLYRISKVFEDKQPVRHYSPVIERKALAREEELKEEMGMHLC